MNHTENNNNLNSETPNPNPPTDHLNVTPYSEPIYSAPTHDPQTPFNQTHYNQPFVNANYNEPQYTNEPVYNQHVQQPQPFYNNDPHYTAQAYFAQQNSDQGYSPVTTNEPQRFPGDMYSPGICVNQPDPRARANGNGTSNIPRERNNSGLVGFIRAMALVLVCAFLSAAAAYAVIEYRMNRDDFTTTPQINQVTLGAPVPERRYSEENVPTPVVAAPDVMSAEDIFDMARSQVVVISSYMPGLFGNSPVSGSGFIISDDGFILTNHHVIELAHLNNVPIIVTLNDGTSYEAEVIGFEASNDVAVIKISAEGLSPVHIGNSDAIRVGQTVYAIGNPFGDLVYTMTDGIVSALDRVVSVEGKSISTFQFSAAVNQGNSGGPIFNTQGEVLGIVTAKVVRGNVEGIGFAIPINDAMEIAIELLERGYLSGRPLLGIIGQTVSPANAAYLDWVEGVLIRDVTSGSAADNAGIEVGDILVELGGEEVTSLELLRFALRDHRAGDTTSITVWRQGELIDLTITFDEDLHAGRPEPRPPFEEPELPDPFEDMP